MNCGNSGGDLCQCIFMCVSLLSCAHTLTIAVDLFILPKCQCLMIQEVHLCEAGWVALWLTSAVTEILVCAEGLLH